MVFLCCDLDRNWSKDQMRWAPVAWFPKSYSLTTEVFRNIVEKVHDECQAYGVHVPCESFDEQLHSIVVRSLDHRPLTVLQLHKDVWHETEKMQKSQILKKLVDINRNYSCSKVDNVIFVTNGGKHLPVLRTSTFQKVKRKKSDDKVDEKKDSVVDHVPDEIIEKTSSEEIGIAGVNTAVMKYEDSKAEMQSCNASKNKWVEISTDFSEDSSPDQSDDNEDDIIDISALERMSTLQPNELNVSEETTRDKQYSEETTRDEQEKIELVFSDENLQSILLLLRTDSAANKNCKWDSRNTNYIKSAR